MLPATATHNIAELTYSILYYTNEVNAVIFIIYAAIQVFVDLTGE